MSNHGIEEANRAASNLSGVRSDFQYGSILEQKRYLFVLPYVAGRDVLDCASGIGWGSYVMATAGARKVVGVELSPIAVASARRYYAHDHLTYVNSALAKAELKPSSFDIFTSFETLEHVEEPTNFLAKLRTLARPDARLYLSTPNAIAFKFPGEAPYNPFHINEFTKEEVACMLEGSGWSPLEYRGQHLMPRNSADIDAYRGFIRRYWRGERIARSPFGLPWRIACFAGRMLGHRLEEPAFVGHCEPSPVPAGMEPAYHYFVATPR